MEDDRLVGVTVSSREDAVEEPAASPAAGGGEGGEAGPAPAGFWLSTAAGAGPFQAEVDDPVLPEEPEAGAGAGAGAGAFFFGGMGPVGKLCVCVVLFTFCCSRWRLSVTKVCVRAADVDRLPKLQGHELQALSCHQKFLG